MLSWIGPLPQAVFDTQNKDGNKYLQIISSKKQKKEIPTAKVQKNINSMQDSYAEEQYAGGVRTEHRPFKVPI